MPEHKPNRTCKRYLLQRSSTGHRSPSLCDYPQYLHQRRHAAVVHQVLKRWPRKRTVTSGQHIFRHCCREWKQPRAAIHVHVELQVGLIRRGQEVGCISEVVSMKRLDLDNKKTKTHATSSE